MSFVYEKNTNTLSLWPWNIEESTLWMIDIVQWVGYCYFPFVDKRLNALLTMRIQFIHFYREKSFCPHNRYSRPSNVYFVHITVLLYYRKYDVQERSLVWHIPWVCKLQKKYLKTSRVVEKHVVRHTQESHLETSWILWNSAKCSYTVAGLQMAFLTGLH